MSVPFFRAPSRRRVVFLSAVATAVVALGGAACGDDETDVEAQIRSFCESLLSSQGFACCDGNDKGDVLFSSRNPAELAELVSSAGPRAKAGLPQEAAAFGEVVVIVILCR